MSVCLEGMLHPIFACCEPKTASQKLRTKNCEPKTANQNLRAKNCARVVFALDADEESIHSAQKDAILHKQIAQDYTGKMFYVKLTAA